MISDASKSAVQGIVGVFETGRVGGDPAALAILEDGAGISYGIHQATERSGTLARIIREYQTLGGRYAADIIKAYSPRDQAVLMDLLIAAGRGDPIMRAAQVVVFDAVYWDPCADMCEAMGLTLPLSWLAVYDTCIQSGPRAVERMRARFPERPPAKGGDERAWTIAYIRARHEWLASFVGSKPAHTTLVRSTVYRTQAMRALVDAGNWRLVSPMTVMGRTL